MCPVLAQVVRFTENFKMSLKLEKKRSKPNVVSTPANHILGPQKLKTFVDSGPAW